MFPAARRFPVFLSGALLLAAALRAADTAPIRSAPTRPGAAPSAPGISAPALPVTGKRIGGIEYVAVSDVAARLCLQVGALDKRRATLTGAGPTRVEFE